MWVFYVKFYIFRVLDIDLVISLIWDDIDMHSVSFESFGEFSLTTVIEVFWKIKIDFTIKFNGITNS